MNNRNPGRRRGRNNNNNRGHGNRGGGGVDRDNRIDSRARGNAAQMLDKYKKMAQDAQVNDDRVNAEYYHQFADHYFRVNADSQARRDEQRIAREEAREGQRSQNDRNSNDDGENDRDNRQPRGRPQRDNRSDNRNDSRNQDTSGAEETEVKAEEKKPVRTRRPRQTETKPSNGAASESNGLDASALPPAIATSKASKDSVDDDNAVEEVKVEKKPVRKRRTVKPKVAKAVDGEEAA